MAKKTTSDKSEPTMNAAEQEALLTLNEMAVNLLQTRQKLLSNALDPRRDIDLECGYPKDITPEQYRLLYDREGLSTRVVSVYPEESWSVDPEVYETEDANLTEFEEVWESLLDEHNIWHYLQRADELSGIGQFGIILFGLDDGKELSEPVEGIDESGEAIGSPQHELLFLRCFDQSLVEIVSKERDPKNRRFGQPTMYDVMLDDPTSSDEHSTQAKTKIHWSRILHIADNRKSSEILGTPRMRPVFNRLYDLRKLLGGSAEMFWKGAFPGISFEMNPDAAEEAELDADSIRDEFRKYSDGLQRYLAVTGVTAKSLAPQVASPQDHIMNQLRAITITLSVPLRIFLGSEAAHLASTQDQENWNARLKRRQNKYLSPMMIRPFVRRLMLYGVLPFIEQFFTEWPDLNSPTDEDKAKIAETLTRAIAQYIQGNVDLLIPPLDYLTKIIGMPLDEAEAIIKAAEKRVAELEEDELEEDDMDDEDEDFEEEEDADDMEDD